MDQWKITEKGQLRAYRMLVMAAKLACLTLPQLRLKSINSLLRRKLPILCCRYQHQKKQSHNSDSKIQITEIKQDSPVTIGEKVKQTTKDAYYGGIIIVGVAVAGVIFYAIFRELFSKESPNGIYGKALKLCLQTPRLVDTLGEPVKGYGKTTSRGRRRHPSYIEYVQDGVNHIRMKFFVEGSRRKGTVHLEVKQNSSGKYDYRYLFVEMSDYPKETIILLDNRQQ